MTDGSSALKKESGVQAGPWPNYEVIEGGGKGPDKKPDIGLDVTDLIRIAKLVEAIYKEINRNKQDPSEIIEVIDLGDSVQVTYGDGTICSYHKDDIPIAELKWLEEKSKGGGGSGAADDYKKGTSSSGTSEESNNPQVNYSQEADGSIGLIKGDNTGASDANEGAGNTTTEVSKTTEVFRKKINEVNQLMQDAANKKTLEILESQSKTAAGPCLSEIYDPLTGKIVYGQNFKTSATGKTQYYQWLENDADPLTKSLVSNYETKIKNGEIVLSEHADYRLAAHSEIVALDEILKNRRALGLPVDETTLSELYLQNIDLTKAYKTGEIVPKIRCEHCRYLTEGINILNHD